VLLGNLAAEARYGEEIFFAARSWVGRIPGSLSIATVMTCAAFGTVSGSSIATSAMMAKIAVPEMEKAKYKESLALGTVASAGPLAGIIPPSVLVCLYGAIVEQPIGKLLVSGFLPGLLIAFLYSAMIYIRARIDPNLAPPATVMLSWREKFASLRNIWPVVIIAMVMLGGIYAGVFTPNEGAGMGAFAVLILGIGMRRLGWKSIVRALEGTLRIVGILMLILSGAFIFNSLLVLGGVTQNLINFVERMQIGPLSILVCIMILFLFLGCFMDTAAMLFLALPVVYPLAVKTGFDPIWFGMLIIVNCETGMITPPFGLTLFATKGALPEKSLGTIIRGSYPFVICCVVALILLIIFPQIILFLPNQMK
jgi:tripartite ATP-independent transporter DctM subunit